VVWVRGAVVLWVLEERVLVGERRVMGRIEKGRGGGY